LRSLNTAHHTGSMSGRSQYQHKKIRLWRIASRYRCVVLQFNKAVVAKAEHIVWLVQLHSLFVVLVNSN
jgi:hypothetical protein